MVKSIRVLSVLAAGVILIAVVVVWILSQLNMGAEMRGIVIGAMLVALAGVIGQLVSAGVKSWQDHEQHIRDSDDRGKQWDRENALQTAQWGREDQLAVDAERRAVAERIWERRANSYDELLIKLGELRDEARYGELAAGRGDIDASITNSGSGGGKLAELQNRNLYWSDATLTSLHEFGQAGALAYREAIAKRDLESYAAYFKTLRNETRKLEDLVRVQGQLHLGDRRPSMAVVMDMAERASAIDN